MNIQINIKVCRVCMKAQSGTSMLEDGSLHSKFEFVTNLRVRQSDNLPAIICAKCIFLLNISYKFIRSAQATEQNLKTFLTKINNDFKMVTKSLPAEKSTNSPEMFSLIDTSEGAEAINEFMASSPGKFVKTDHKFDHNTVESNPSNAESISSDPEYSLFTTDENEHENEGPFLKSEKIFPNTDHEHLESKEVENVENVIDVDEEDFTMVGSNIKTDPLDHENYETLLEEENETMDIIYEDNEEENIKGKNDSPVILETIVLKEDFVKREFSQNPTTSKPLSMGISSKSKSSVDCSQKKYASKKSIDPVNENFRFCCTQCNRDFSTKTNLTRHMQLHEGKKQYQCKICNKSFSQNGTLKLHMYIHTGERPHVCSICDRGFTQSKSLVFHMRRHTGEMPHQCEQCGSLFRQKDALKIHIIKRHADIKEQTFSCKICQKELSAEELNIHMKQHVNNHKAVEIDTGDMMQAFEEGDLADENVYIKDEFPLTHVMDATASSTAEASRAKKYQCRKCFKSFAIKKSLIRHLGFHDIALVSSLYQCEECDLAFDTNYALNFHRVQEHKDTEINLIEGSADKLGIENYRDYTYTCSQCPDTTFATHRLLNAHLLEHNINEIDDDA